jgi:hypothetical protein
MAAYRRHLLHKRSPMSAEFMCLIVVLVAGAATAWFAAHQIGMNLSAIETVASVLGINETVGTPPDVGYTQAQADQTDSSLPPYCQAGAAPAFVNGLAALKQQIGEVMGTPLECEHTASAQGDTIQQTSTGLAAYDSLTNTDTFTDGWHHWALTSDGVVTWDGTESRPPVQAETAANPS